MLNTHNDDSLPAEADSGEVRIDNEFKREQNNCSGASETKLSDAAKNVSISQLEFDMNTKEKIFNLTQDVREIVGIVVNDDRVQNFILFLIVINSIMLGLGTFSFVNDNPRIEYIFEMVDKVFLIIFTVELCMQFIFHLWSMFKDGWLVFDFVVVLMSWLFNKMQGIRAFRIFRALRLITRFSNMRNLITALLCVMPRLGTIIGLLCIIFYVFGVMFTDLFMVTEVSDDLDDEACHYYFQTLHHTLFTLFQMMTLEWASVARPCMDEYSWAWAPIVIFVMITSFIVFNLIVAVVCDAVSELNESRKEKDKVEKALMKIKEKNDIEVQIKLMSSEVKSLIENQERIQKALEFFALRAMTD